MVIDPDAEGFAVRLTVATTLLAIVLVPAVKLHPLILPALLLNLIETSLVRIAMGLPSYNAATGRVTVLPRTTPMLSFPK
jgi:hypothetical protein